jgi:DNA repair photolyase
MPIIYEPKGKALEYSPLAANLYKGCSHGCEYCYVPGIPPYKFEKNPRQAFYGKPAPRPGVLAELERDARRLAGDKRRILMSFTSDPYQPIEREHEITRRAMAILAENGLKPQVLTKGGEWAVKRDADVLKATGCVWAATLTCDDDDASIRWEPQAGLPGDRIAALERAHGIGLETWVSLEPVVDPDAAVRLIHATHKFVDLYKVGKLNHHSHADTIDWSDFLERVEDALNQHGKARYIKVDLEKHRRKCS